MRRFLSWHLPLTIGAIATVLFAWGLWMGLAGEAGTMVVGAVEPKQAATPEPGRVRLLLLGDSLARGVGDPTGKGIGGYLHDFLKEREIEVAPPVNIAVSGARTEDLLEQLESPNVRELLARSNLIILSIGGNDLHGESRNGRPANPALVMETVLGEVQRAIERIREASPSSRIFVVGLYNPFVEQGEAAPLSVAVQRWNAELRIRFANDPNLHVVETSDVVERPGRLSLDRFHPGGEAYQIVARRILDVI